MSIPKGKRVQLPHGMYVQFTGMLDRKLQTLYRRFRSKDLTKAQVRKKGEEEIDNHYDRILEVTLQRSSKQFTVTKEPTEREQSEILGYKAQAKAEWSRIVDDM